MRFGVFNGAPAAAVFPPPFRFRCSSSASSGHASFIKEIAATQPPKNLPHLLNVLQTRGEEILSPGSRQGLIPIVIPLTKNLSGTVTGLLRWPTAPPGILVEEETNLYESGAKLYLASSEAGKELYRKGDFANSQIMNLDVYLLKKVGMFPDVLERKVNRHFDEGDDVSIMVTGEFYTKDLFPGFGRPFGFYAEILLRVGLASESRDAARVALKSPWWTLGCAYKEVARMANWEVKQIEYIKEKVFEEGRRDGIKKGKTPAQVSLDEAAFLLDLAYVEGIWDDHVERVAECYKAQGLMTCPDLFLIQFNSMYRNVLNYHLIGLYNFRDLYVLYVKTLYCCELFNKNNYLIF